MKEITIHMKSIKIEERPLKLKDTWYCHWLRNGFLILSNEKPLLTNIDKE